MTHVALYNRSISGGEGKARPRHLIARGAEIDAATGVYRDQLARIRRHISRSDVPGTGDITASGKGNSTVRCGRGIHHEIVNLGDDEITAAGNVCIDRCDPRAKGRTRRSGHREVI